jgi:aryl-alcohol dehydrogenase-like predicted oxidoreductase
MGKLRARAFQHGVPLKETAPVGSGYRQASRKTEKEEMDSNRRRLLGGAGAMALAAGLPLPSHAADGLVSKPIPSTGEMIPVIGLGTARRFQGASGEAELAPLRETLRSFQALGGTVIDTAPSYGDAEAVVGLLLSQLKSASPVFLATKVGATGRAAGEAQIDQSVDHLQRRPLDLIAVHNLQDIETQLGLLRELKAAKRIRYLGATTSSDRQYQPFEAMMKKQSLDFVQVDFALDNRGAAERLLPLARDRGMGVMVNLPFGRGRLFDATRGRPLPPWATEFDCASWAQFFLKYIVSHDAVTCAIPGMAKPAYVVDNMGAAAGRLPDPAMRKRMAAFIDAL